MAYQHYLAEKNAFWSWRINATFIHFYSNKFNSYFISKKKATLIYCVLMFYFSYYSLNYDEL